MQLSTAFRNARVDVVGDGVNSMSLEIRSGAMPANPAAADAGAALSTIALPADAMAAASGGAAAKSGTWEDTSADANGLARHFRIKDGSTCLVQGLVSMPWPASAAVIVGQQVHNGGNVYVCATAGTTASSGGPTGTGSAISDGSAVWDYVGPVDMTIQNVSIAAGQAVTVTGFTLTDANA